MAQEIRIDIYSCLLYTSNETIAILIEQANACLEAMGYTDHGPRHVGYVSRITRQILHELGFDERTVELGAIAGWVHDVGNAINRDGHCLLYTSRCV